MTDFLADDTLTRILQAVAADPADPADVATACAAVDRLQELGATLADVLVLYAGTPPYFADGLPQAVLVQWCRATDGVRRPVHTPNRWALIAEIQGETAERQPGVVEHRVRPIASNDFFRVVFFGRGVTVSSGIPNRLPVSRPHDDFARDIAAAKIELIRAVKRRVLTLFPEVRCDERVVYRRAVSSGGITATLAHETYDGLFRAVERFRHENDHRNGIGFSCGTVEREMKVVFASDLIPPEPSPALYEGTPVRDQDGRTIGQVRNSRSDARGVFADLVLDGETVRDVMLSRRLQEANRGAMADALARNAERRLLDDPPLSPPPMPPG